MNELTTISGAIGTYGLYSIIGCLVIAVIYLFKQVNDLNKQIQLILTEQAKQSAELTSKVVIALDASTKAIERVDFHLLDVKAGKP